MTKILQSGLVIGAVLLCSFSLVASVAFWVTRQPNIEKMVMAGVFATGLEVCKFAFFALAKKTVSRIWSFFLYMIAVVLLAFSVFITVVFLESGATSNLEIISTSSFVYHEQQNIIHKLDSESATLIESQANDLKGKYKTRGYSISTRLKALRVEKAAALEKLNTLKGVQESREDSIFKTVGEMLGITAQLAQLLLFLFGAMLVDICGVICILAITVKHKIAVIAPTLQLDNATLQEKVIAPCKPENTRVASLQEKVAPLQVAEVAQKLQVAKPVKHTEVALAIATCNISEELSVIKQKIASGFYGNTLKITVLMAETKRRHPELSRILLELVGEGICRKIRRTYEVIETAKVIPLKPN